MVCFRHIIVNTHHKADNKDGGGDDDDNDNNNNNNNVYYYYYVVVVAVSCHRPFLPDVSLLAPTVIPTALASSFTLQYFPYYV